jgi:tetratricopeptide (TPR) repeat protein
MTARVHLALLALAIVVLVAGGLVAFLLWRPQSHHSIQVNRQAQVQVPPRPRRLVPEVSEKDKSRLAAAARRVPLATVMHWYGQQRFADGNAPGTMSIPSECLKEAQADPKLYNWLAEWHARLLHGQGALQEDRAVLSDLVLKRTSLSSLTLLDIGRAVDFFSDDEATAARFYAAAGLRGAKEAPATNSSLAYRQMLLGLNSTRPLLWRVIDGGDRQTVPALKTLCDTIAKWPPGTGDKRLDSDCIFAMIDSAECLHSLGRNEEALQALDKIYALDLTPQQQFAANWASSLTLFYTERYAQAVPYLQSCCDIASPRRREALPILFMASVRSGDMQSARDLYQQLRVNCPPRYSLSQFAAQLQIAESTK